MPSHKWLFRRAAAACAIASAALALAQSISVQFERGSFRVVGWTPPRTVPVQGWPSVFAVYAGAPNLPPMLGSYSVEGGSLVFHPAYPIAPGVRYRAVFRPPGGTPIERTFDFPAQDTVRRTRVERVYPTADVWPGNILRLYIYFSAPMSRGESARRLHVLDENGKELQGIFLPGQELWDPDYQRLTMTFDPGRIKRGLTSNVAMGSPITEGKRYRLVIDADWPDARGVPLVEGYTRSFRGAPADRETPDPKQWRISSPKAGSSDALTVDFPEPLNYALLLRMLRVPGIDGGVSIERQETRWRLTPRAPWKPGDYQLVVDSGIEDLAGNRVGQRFDTDLQAAKPAMPPKSISLPFSVR